MTRRLLIIVVAVATVAGLIVELYVVNAFLYHGWAGSFAQTEQSAEHHQGMMRLLGLYAILTPAAVVVVWLLAYRVRKMSVDEGRSE